MEDNGDVIIGDYSTKAGNETLFLDAIAPFVEPGFYDWEGEDGSKWRDVYADGERQELAGITIYQ